MARKSSLPILSDCFDTAPRSASLSDHRITSAIFVFVVIAGLALAHIHLRFAINDLRVQHRELQGDYQDLVRRQQAIQLQNERLADTDTLIAMARSRGMERVAPSMAEPRALPGDLAAKYSSSDGSVVAGLAPVLDTAGASVKDVLIKLVETRSASAAGTKD
ncbi:MAG: hypothetical protein K1X53_03850 [Candidatus Sumerlaeaceae bacterium]|nr:hypothetical protein [Candidatus Sumerlaeaceae bacterium]